ncbi:hypothetical protein BDV93DRAFT_605475 [Ceratobasidium sp. AG-I]|nr:hypothetical protein BDV93DRAFT_605475 [Ceratobasidium sp. AG-I]
MSQLPVTALLKAIPASRQTAGQTITWQADVPPDYLRLPTPPELRQDMQDELNARKPWLKNPAMLDDIVPESERHGHNEDGIPRKLAWLAKHGYTVHSYNEILSAETLPPQTSRKERRQLLAEKKRVQHANNERAREAAKASSSSRRSNKGPAMSVSPRGAYSHAPTSGSSMSPPPSTPAYYTPSPEYSAPSPAPSRSSRTGSVQPHAHTYSHSRATPTPDPQLDASTWLDSFHPVNPDFLPEAALPPNQAMMAEINGIYAQEYGYAQPAHGEGYSGYPVYEQPVMQYAGPVRPEFPAYSGAQAGSSGYQAQYQRPY